jgi:hypothetical protein
MVGEIVPYMVEKVLQEMVGKVGQAYQDMTR